MSHTDGLRVTQVEQARDVLLVPSWRFHARPQVGTALRVTWEELARWLSQPTIGTAKDGAGAWSPALYRDNVRRKSALICAHSLVVDVDHGGDVDSLAMVLRRYRVILHSTFSSTPDAPRCRVVLDLAEPIDAATYDAAHAVVRAHLRRAGVFADDGAKDASRLSYAPVVRPGAGYRFRALEGVPLDAGAMLAAQPVRPPRSSPGLPTPKHENSYVRGALRRAAGAVAGSNPGTRHYALSREAFSLARLSVAEHEIAAALLPAFVETAGERRTREGQRTIRDAVRARRGAT